MFKKAKISALFLVLLLVACVFTQPLASFAYEGEPGSPEEPSSVGDVPDPEPAAPAHEGPHIYEDGVCTLCGEPIVWDLYFTDEARTDEYIRIYSTNENGERELLSHEELREIAVIAIMLKTDQPDYRYEVGMNADWHGNPNAFQYNDIYVETMAQFNNDYDTIYFTLMLNEDHELSLYDVHGGTARVVLFSLYDEETGTYDNLSPDGHPQYGLEFDLVRREPGVAPPVLNTVPNSGFKINLYDYSVGESSADINDVSDLRFYNDNAAEAGAEKESNAVSESAVAKQGIVEAEIGEDGFPTLTEFGGDSLDVLFDEGETRAKDVYRNVDGLFMDDGDGGLVYNSALSYAYYDTAQGDGGQFTVYDGTYNQERLTDLSKIDSGVSVGFFPFDPYNDMKTNVSAKAEDALNHGLGMFIESDVIIPESGKIDGEPLTFHFEGDDDAWLFIDDVLVLDGGGIHGAVSGKVDFSTGRVTVSNAVSIGAAGNTTGTNTTLETIFENVGKEYTRKGTHTVKFYSLERDGSVSDLKIETNLNKVVDQELTDVTVEKKWVDENGKETDPWLKNVTVQLYQTVDGEKTAVGGKTLMLNEGNEWKGIFKSLPAKTADGKNIDYTVEENAADSTSVTYERGGEEVRSDIYWVRADFSEGMEPGIYAIMGYEYDDSDTPRTVLLTEQGEDKEVTYRDAYITPADEPITDPRDGKTYTEYLEPVGDDQIWTIAQTAPVQSFTRMQSTTEYETVTGPDGTVYKVLSPYIPAYAAMSIPSYWQSTGNLPYITNSNTEFYVVDDGDSSRTTYYGDFYVKDSDGSFVPMQDDLGTLYMHTYLMENGYIKCVDNSDGKIYYEKEGESGYYKKTSWNSSTYEKLTDSEMSQLGSITRLSNCEKNEDGYVVWYATMNSQPPRIYSDETFYQFYQLTDSGYEEISAPMSGQYMPTVIPEKDENGYILLYSYSNAVYYAKEDGTVWEKDSDGNYTQVYPTMGAGYVKMKLTEMEGPVYDWVISNRGLNLTLVGPGQQWMDYTYITSTKDGQGNSNDSTVGSGSWAMGSAYLRSLYSDYNYRNVFRFDNMGSAYGDEPGNGTYEEFGARIFSFQDIWIFEGFVMPYEKNVTINTSTYTTKESYDLTQAGRFWFYKPVPVPQTYDMSQNDWTLINAPAGDLTITKQVLSAAGSDSFTFAVTLKDKDGKVADSVTGTYGDIEFVGGLAVVTLKAGESLTAKNLPAGLKYSVAETVPDPYVLDAKTGDSGTIKAGEIASAVFTNRIPQGALTVSKEVEGEGAPADDAFTFHVTLSDSTVNGTYGDMSFSAGVADITLKNGESATASGLPTGISYAVTEDALAHYTISKLENAEGQIADGETAEASFVNHYKKPEEPPESSEPSEPSEPSSSKPETPGTGDPHQIWPWIVVFAAGIVLGGGLIFARKRSGRTGKEK